MNYIVPRGSNGPEDVNFIYDIQPGIYTKKSVPHALRKEAYDLLNIRPGLYTKKSVPHALRKEAHDLLNVNAYPKARKSVPHTLRREAYDLLNVNAYPKSRKAIPKEARREMFEALPKPGVYDDARVKVPRSIRKARFDRIAPAHNQLKRALSNIRSMNARNKLSISFDLNGFNDECRDYFNEHIGKVLLELLEKYTIGSNIVCSYRFPEESRTKIFDDWYARDLLYQLRHEGFISLIESANSSVMESIYDYFITGIRNLDSFSFIDIDEPEITIEDLQGKPKKTEAEIFKDDIVYQALVKSGDKDALEAYVSKELREKKQYKTKDGNFWKYTLTIPINLERYQIFNTVDTRTAKLMTEDNCLIYACIQAGVDANIIDRMRDIVRVRSFPQSKLSELANDLGITFIVTITYLNEDNTKDANKRRKVEYKPKDTVSSMTINLILIDGHYMLNERIPITTYYIQHYEEIINALPDADNERLQKINRFSEGKYKINNQLTTSIENILKACFKYNRFKPITIGSIATYASLLYKEKLERLPTLEYDQKFCTRLKEQYVKKANTKNDKNKKKFMFEREHTIYADFETTTDGIHKAFNICYSEPNTSFKGSIWGENCGKEFLNIVPDNSLIYYHNLSYDINFIINLLDKIIGTPIIKGTRVMSVTGRYRGKNLCFKDTYTIISSKLKAFPAMFGLETGPKEVFPYTYYSSELLADDNRIGVISEAANHVEDRKTFINNINSIPGCKLSETTFDLEKYSAYYCEQDVRILQEGFEKFRNDLLKLFDLDVYDFISICSIANKYFENNVYHKNGNLYDLANTPREFISRCVRGGRCMLWNNEKQMILNEDPVRAELEVVDFDAVSLYPSAIARLYTLEGRPKVMTDDMLSTEYLLKHLFLDEQVTPTAERFVAGFFVEVEITSVGVNRNMPLIVVDPEFNPQLKGVPRSSNTCCTMYIDHIEFQDLITFHKCEFKVKRGYYYNENRDYTIRSEIRKLFDLRRKYKKEGNSLQQVIKLILNSIYGRTILKPIETKMKFIKDKDAIRFLRKNYNSIVEFKSLYESDFTAFKCLKPIVRHYNFCPLGVNILSMSKRIMNEVFTIAEDAGMKILYTDTDSGHFYKKDLPVIEKLYKERYGRELIGGDLGQFHSDFAQIDPGHDSTAIKSIFVGKKSYIDMLTNDLGSVAFHCRLKGVIQEVIAVKANEMFPDAVQVEYDEDKGLFIPVSDYTKCSEFSIFNLYKSLYDGDEISFDLCSGSKKCFQFNKDFSIETKSTFIRKLRF
ncbi:MAG: DNA polymerase [Enterococcus lemanii]